MDDLQRNSTHYEISPVTSTAEPSLMPVGRLRNKFFISSHCIFPQFSFNLIIYKVLFTLS